jgi:hypothetical protein
MNALELIQKVKPEDKWDYRRVFIFTKNFSYVIASDEREGYVKAYGSKKPSSLNDFSTTYRGVPIPFLNNHCNIVYYPHDKFTVILEQKYFKRYKGNRDIGIFKIPFITYNAVAVINKQNYAVEYKNRVYAVSTNDTQYPSYILYNEPDNTVFRITHVPSGKILISVASKNENWKEQSFYVDRVILEGLNPDAPYVYGIKTENGKLSILTTIKGHVVQIPASKQFITKEVLNNYIIEINRLQVEGNSMHIHGNIYDPFFYSRDDVMQKFSYSEGNMELPPDFVLAQRINQNKSVYLSTEQRKLALVRDGKVVAYIPSALRYTKFKDVQVKGQDSTVIPVSEAYTFAHYISTAYAHYPAVYSVKVFYPEEGNYFAVAEWIRQEKKERVLPYLSVYDKKTGKKVMEVKNLYKQGHVVPFNQSGSHRYVVYIEAEGKRWDRGFDDFMHIIDLKTLQDTKYTIKKDVLADRLYLTKMMKYYGSPPPIDYKKNFIKDNIYFRFDGDKLHAYQSGVDSSIADHEVSRCIYSKFFSVDLKNKVVIQPKKPNDTYIFVQDPFFPLDKDMYSESDVSKIAGEEYSEKGDDYGL